MNKIILGLLFLVVTLKGVDVPIETAQTKSFSKNIEVNSQIVQQNSAQESVMARVGGKVIAYYVEQGQSINKGDKIATIESLELSKLSSELALLRKQLIIHNKNYTLLKNLYTSGLESLEKLNKEERERDETAYKIKSLERQLKLLGVNKLQSNTYTIYAQTSGKVSEILVPKSTIVDTNKALVSIIKGGESLLVKSFIPMHYVEEIRLGQKGIVFYGKHTYPIRIAQILPKLDETTQQIVVFSSLEERAKNLFINAYTRAKLTIGEPKKYVAVKKSALSFFNNEWVVFVPKEHEKEEHHEDQEAHIDTHKGHNHENHEGHDHDSHNEEDEEHHEHEHDTHDNEESENEHGHHEEQEVPYEIRVVNVIEHDKEYVAIEGLEEGERYVSDRSYYIKSLLLKSSLGGHGH